MGFTAFVRFISFLSCKIGEKGGRAVGEALKGNTTLTELVIKDR